MTTTIVYPDAGTGGTTVDGHVRRHAVDQSFSDIRTSAGTGHIDNSVNENCAQLTASATTNQFSVLRRGIMTVDTTAVSATDTISSVTVSVYGSGKDNGLGETALDVVSANPASNNDLVHADYAYTLFGTLPFGSISYASYSTSAYNDIDCSSDVITKGGISKIGLRLSWDTQNSFGGSWSSTPAVTSYQMYFADNAGTTNDPKVTVVHTATARRAIIVS